MFEVSWDVWKSIIWHKMKHFINEDAFLFYQTNQSRKCFLETHNNPMSRSSHHFLFEMVLSSMTAGQSMTPSLPCWWRSRTGGQWWEKMQHFAHSSVPSRLTWHLLVNITLDKSIFLYFLAHFNLLDLCLWLRGDLACLGFLGDGYFLPHFARSRQR